MVAAIRLLRSIPDDMSRCPEDENKAVAVTLVDLLSGISAGPAVRTPPPPGVARRCCWCGRIMRFPGDTASPTRTIDGICLACSLAVQFDGNARRFGVILFPERVLADASLPLRWRVYGELQRAGGAVRWIEPHPAQLASLLDRERRAVSRAITQLVAAGYLLRRPRRQHPRRGAVTVYEVRVTMGRASPRFQAAEEEEQ